MFNENKDYCCNGFKKDVEEGNIVRGDTGDRTEWYDKKWSRINYCPYCGSSVSKEGPRAVQINGSSNHLADSTQNNINNRLIAPKKKKRASVIKNLLLIVLIPFTILVLITIYEYIKWHPLYKIVDSGVWTSPGPHKIFWLDNNRVFFYSNEKLVPGGGPERGVIWDTSTGKVTVSHQFGEWGKIRCIRDDQVFYFIRDKNTREITYYFGSLEGGRGYPQPSEDMSIDERFDCDWVPKNTMGSEGPAEGPPYRYKLKGENYVEVLEKNKHSSRDNSWKPGRMIYHERNEDKGTVLPPEISLYSITYYPFLDAYIATHSPINPKVESRTIDSYWMIERNGRFKEHRYPRKWQRQQFNVYPVKEGCLLQGGEAKRGAGNFLYLVRGEKMELLMRGLPRLLSVSPDGCKVAFEHAKNRNYDLQLPWPLPYRTLKMINTCEWQTNSK